MADNTAVYLVTTKASLEVKAATRPVPKDNEIVIKTRAVALNPVDWAIQDYGPEVFKFIPLPHIPGYDIAGEVTTVGSAVTKFRIGDRVAGLCHGGGGSQEYSPLQEHLTTHVPDSLTWEQAAVLPMGTSVGIKALFHKDYLALDLPVVVVGKQPPTPKGKTVFIGGAATSVGSCTIQLAVAAGYEVISTSSSKNFEYVKSLGASQVFDYNSATIQEDLVAAFRGKTSAGAVANGGFGGIDGSGPSSVQAAATAVLSCPGKKFVAMTMAPVWGPSVEGVELKFVEQLQSDAELASAVLHGYLPDALAQGSFRPLPDSEVIGQGLEAIQGAMDTLKKGVSRKKLVVTM